MEYTDEDWERYNARVKAREELKARQQKEPEQPVASRPSNVKPVPFTSRIGKKFAGALDKATGKAEAYREKADYISNRAGRIKKAIVPAGKPKAKARPVGLSLGRKITGQAKKRRVKPYYQSPAPVYRQPRPPGEAINDFIHGARTQTPHRSDPFEQFIGFDNGQGKKKRGKSNKDFFRDFVG